MKFGESNKWYHVKKTAKYSCFRLCYLLSAAYKKVNKAAKKEVPVLTASHAKGLKRGKVAFVKLRGVKVRWIKKAFTLVILYVLQLQL
jgi:hypothetical protein